MASLAIDIIEGASWREVDGRVEEVIRLARIWDLNATQGSGIGQTPVGKDDIIMSVALSTPRLPKPGDNHPSVAGLICRERRPIALNPRIVQVELVYRLRDMVEPPAGFNSDIEGGVSTEQIETQLDKNGTQITVTHNGTTQGGFIRPRAARRYLRFTRLEQSLSPGVRAQNYANRVNSTTWNAGEPGTWWCDGITFRLENRETDPPTWEYVYSFLYDPDGWDPQVIFVDPETNNPPPDLVEDVGYKTVPYYDAVNFDNLNL